MLHDENPRGIRADWVKRKDHMNDVSKSLKKDNAGRCLLTRLENIIKNPPEKYRYLFTSNYTIRE